MALIRDKSFNTRKQAVELLLRDRHLLIKPEVVEWFSYARICLSESELKEKSEALVDKQVKKSFPRHAEWVKKVEYVVAPYYKFVTSSYPYYFDFSLHLNFIASVEVDWTEDSDEYYENCVVIDLIKRDVEKFKLPLDFLQTISGGNLSQFPQRERDNQGYYTWHIPSIDQDIKLHGVLLRSLGNAFQGKPLGPALVWYGLLSDSEGRLAERSLRMLPSPASTLITEDAPICEREEVMDALTGKSLGMRAKDVNNALDAVFKPSLSLEENIRRCLQFKDDNK